jgi:hypothetical protein
VGVAGGSWPGVGVAGGSWAVAGLAASDRATGIAARKGRSFIEMRRKYSQM